MFSLTDRATKSYSCNYDEKFYLERTKRNHYWLGGVEGQMKLKDLKVGIAGLGGMGSNLAEIMVPGMALTMAIMLFRITVVISSARMTLA